MKKKKRKLKMSKIDEILKNEKVEWMVLGDIGEFYGGLTGKNKNDFTDGNAKYVTYKNVYANPSTLLDMDDKVKINEGENQRKLEYGDIIFTGSSETADECGLSSVITSELKEDLYLNSFCFFLRLNDKNLLLPDFAKHLFRSHLVRKQIIRTASGVTRFNVSKKLMGQVEIPVPTIEVQEKIVKILDEFQELTEDIKNFLSDEIEKREKQYEYYREKLLTFDTERTRGGYQLLSNDYLHLLIEAGKLVGVNVFGVKTKKLGECVDIILGGTPNKNKIEYWENGTIPWINSGEVNKKTIYSSDNFITQKGYDNSSATFVPKDSTVIALAGQGKTRGLVARIKIELTTNQSLATLVPKEELNNDYLYYYLQNEYIKLREVSSGDGTRGGLNKEILSNYKILIPPKPIQEYIVTILDKFEALSQSTTEGLRREIDLREKQYEYYREKLLTFEK